MDVNGSPFWQIAGAQGFGFAGSASSSHANLAWDARANGMRLAGQQAAPDLGEDEALARQLTELPSPVCDQHNSFAWWDTATESLLSSGFQPGAALIELGEDDPAGIAQPTDLAFDTDLLIAARNEKVVMHDRRHRWPDTHVELSGFAPHRLAPLGHGAFLVADRSSGKLARLTGRPLRQRGYDFDTTERFRGEPENPNPPRLDLLPGAVVPAPLEIVAMSGDGSGRVAILCWDPSNEAEILIYERGALTRTAKLADIQFPIAIAWDGPDRLIVLATDSGTLAANALSYDLAQLNNASDPTLPNGRVCPLLDPFAAGLCNSADNSARYLSRGQDGMPRSVMAVRAISRPEFARNGHVTLGPFDSGEFDTVWHRLYVEACLKGSSTIRVWAQASNQRQTFDAPSLSDPAGWSAHQFGGANPHAHPHGSWCREPSEIPGFAGHYQCERSVDEAGLFTALIQTNTTRVRRVAGRYLYLHLELIGDGQHSPEMFAVRAYAKRFAYRDKYLPELYREALTSGDAATEGPATPADFLDRFLGLFEHELTNWEGNIAESWRVTDPLCAPDHALGWLAQWIGIDPRDEVDANRLRQKLACANHLARLNGTLGGIRARLELETGGMVVRGGQLAKGQPIPRPGEFAMAEIDGKSTRALVLAVADPERGGTSQILIGGAVTSGAIAIVEGFRLRRTFATILGADLSTEHDPLTLGLTRSGNSIVGDTLILGEEHNDKLLALFDDDLPKSLREREAVDAFLHELAFRALVLVREGGATGDLARIAAAAKDAAPAHVAIDVQHSDSSFLAGVSSLVGIDSYLTEPTEPERARINLSRIGAGDIIAGEGMLDPRADGPAPYPPVAVADGPERAFADTAFTLSGLRSHAEAGRSISHFVWTWN